MGLQQTANPLDETRLAEMAGGQVDRDDQRRPTLSAPSGQLSADLGQHPVTERDDEIAGLRHRDELVWWDQAALGVEPAHQGLGPDQGLVAQPHLGLEIGAQVASGDGAAQIRFQYQSLDKRGVHCLIVEHAGVAPVLLGSVQGGVGVSHQFGEVDAVVRVERDTDGNGDLQRVAGHGERLAKRRQDLTGHPQCPLLVDLGQQQYKFVTSQPTDRILGPGKRLEALSDLDQQIVALGVTERIVDFLEAVQIEK